MADSTLKPGWCPECRAPKGIEDEYVEDTGDRAVYTEVFWVTVYECGHQQAVKTNEYRSPLQQAGPTPAMRAAMRPGRMEDDDV